MARYTRDITTGKSEDELKKSIQEFMGKEGFKDTVYNQEKVWKKGMGILTGPQFLKTELQSGAVRLQAWIKLALLPGVYIGEMGITGFFGFALKAVLKKRVENLEKLIAG